VDLWAHTALGIGAELRAPGAAAPAALRRRDRQAHDIELALRLSAARCPRAFSDAQHLFPLLCHVGRMHAPPASRIAPAILGGGFVRTLSSMRPVERSALGDALGICLLSPPADRLPSGMTESGPETGAKSVSLPASMNYAAMRWLAKPRYCNDLLRAGTLRHRRHSRSWVGGGVYMSSSPAPPHRARYRSGADRLTGGSFISALRIVSPTTMPAPTKCR